MAAPKLDGNGRHAYQVATNAPSLPLTITAASNDQIEYNELEYLIPAGTYATIQAVADACNAAVADEDNVTHALISTEVYFSVSSSSPTKLKATDVHAGVSVLAFGTGVEHDGLAAIGFTDTAAMAGGDPVD